MELKHIVVPVDGSTASQFALPAALPLARAAGARVHLVQIFQPIALPPEGRAPQPTREGVWASMKRLAAEATSRGQVAATAEVIDGPDPAEELLTRARTLPADLLVMATHGRGGVSRFWVGSVADAVMRLADCPVLLVHSHEDPPPELDAGALFRNILIPLDGSRTAEAALEPATTLAALSGGRLTLLRVVPTHMPLPLIEDPGSVADAVHGEVVGLARAYLSEAVRQLEAHGTNARAELSHAVQVSGAIKKAAETMDADLIVISSRGAGGARRALLGSVADKVVRTVGMPVLVVHPSARE